LIVTSDDPGRGEAVRDALFRRLDPFTAGVIVLCTVIELTLQLADLGLFDAPRLRFVAYTYGGFWPGLLGDWRPNFAGQPALMFLSYSFLHAGFVHFLVNMLTLASLGPLVLDRGGLPRYAAIYVVSVLGGALAYGLLAPGVAPMVGASGGLFGLAGAVLAWDTAERRALRLGLRPVLRVVVFLVLMNLLLWWAMSGQLAWQTHLGGFLAGAALATLLGERRGPVRTFPQA
jgi:membrane associated rhomboid family serine protease